MKQRFSSLDVKVISRELARELTSLRIANIYDLSSRIFLFKFAKPDTRRQLIVDSGFRCHLTEYTRATAAAPSPFVSRLRKTLKTRRVTKVSQIGTDRIIDIELSDGQFHLFLEFFAAGNVILTDREYNVLSLLRVVSEGEGQEQLRVGLTYTLSNKQNYDGVPPLAVDRVKETLQKAVDRETSQAEGAAKKSKKKQGDALRKALSLGFPEYPPLLLDHVFRVVGIDSERRPGEALRDEALLNQVMAALQEAEHVCHHLSTSEDLRGYIVAQEGKTSHVSASATEEASQAKPNLVYDDFHPFKPQQFEGQPGKTILEFQGFNKAVDEYFSSIESQKLESRLTEKEENARRKLEGARRDHEKRVGSLQQAQELHIRKAQVIEANLLRVEEAAAAVNGLVAQGMDWVEIARLIETEQRRHNYVAELIKLPLKLYENTITLLLSEGTFEDNEDDYGSSDDESESDSDVEGSRKPPKSEQVLEVDIDLALSPWSNARQYYDQKKTAALKEQKTIQSSTKALKSTEKKVAANLKKSLKDEKDVLRPSRKPFWFEKFLFFISSDGYLVLGSKDATQSDLLYRKYLKRGDVYVHADLDGAATVIVKNRVNTPDAPIPPGTLSQAGTLCVATSSAWDSKAYMSAWWVKAEQVSKTTATGEYLRTGGFIINGEKNFLPPAQLILGFAVMFQIGTESIPRHTRHRVQDNVPDETNAVSEDTNDQKDLNGEEMNREDLKEDESALGHTPEEKAKGRTPLEEKPDEASESEDEDADDAEDAENKHAVNPLQSNGTNQKDEDAEIDGENDDAEDDGNDEGVVDAKVGVEDAEPNDKQPAGKGKQKQSSEAPSRSSTPSQAQKGGKQQPRGKRGRNKKMAKYADQDEEDRELALRLLGVGKKDKAAEAADAKAKRDAELEAQRQRRRAQHDKAAETERRRQAALQRAAQKADEGAHQHGDGELLEGEGELELTEAEIADLQAIPSLIGTPLPGDEILAAVPVAAPWTALGRYKYRAKLQPGSTKKGKAIKEILGRWVTDASGALTASAKGKGRKAEAAIEEHGLVGEGQNVDRKEIEKLWSRELELIKTWRDVEVVNTLPVRNVRVMMGSGGDSKGSGAKGKGGGKGGGGGGKGGKGGKKGK